MLVLLLMLLLLLLLLVLLHGGGKGGLVLRHGRRQRQTHWADTRHVERQEERIGGLNVGQRLLSSLHGGEFRRLVEREELGVWLLLDDRRLLRFAVDRSGRRSVRWGQERAAHRQHVTTTTAGETCD